MKGGWLLLVLVLWTLGKSYHYLEINPKIYSPANGDAQVIQECTGVFNGSFSWALGACVIVFNQLLEKTEASWQRLEPLGLISNQYSLDIRWGYTARGEIKTFRSDFTIIGAVKRFQDIAEFYTKIIEDAHEKIDQLSIKLFLPFAQPDLFKVYPRGADCGQVCLRWKSPNVIFKGIGGGKKTFTDETVKQSIKEHPTKTQSILIDLLDQAISWWQKESDGDLLNLRSTNACNTYFL